METAGQAVLRLPVLGWLVRDAIHGLPDAKYYFFANCALGLACGGLLRRLSPRHHAGADRDWGFAGLSRLHDRRRQVLQSQPSGLGARGASGGETGRSDFDRALRLRLVVALWARRLAAGNDIAALQPAMQVDVGAAARAERVVLRVARAAANDADGPGLRGRDRRAAGFLAGSAIAQTPGVQARCAT